MQLWWVKITYSDRWNISGHLFFCQGEMYVDWLSCCPCGRLLHTHKLSKANFKGAYLCANCVHAAAERQICFCPLLPCLSAAAEWTQPMEKGRVCCEYSVVSCPWVCGWRFCSVKCTGCVYGVCLTEVRWDFFFFAATVTKVINTHTEMEGD